jgi:hypothetical protein
MKNNYLELLEIQVVTKIKYAIKIKCIKIDHLR